MHTREVHIESPCHASWEAMTGDGPRRFCGACDKHVHDLSAMTHDEAAALVDRHGDDLCVRYVSESDGTLRFRDLVPAVSLTRRIARTALAGALLAACTPHGEGPAPGNLGDAIIEAIRQDTVPTRDGGCDYSPGPFTTVHLPAGHVLCRETGEAPELRAPGEVLEPQTAGATVDPRTAGALGGLRAVPPPEPREIQGGIRSRPAPQQGEPQVVPDDREPCDPLADKPPRVERADPLPRKGQMKRLMGKPKLPRHDD